MLPVVADHESDARRAPCPGALAELIRLVRAARPGELVAVLASAGPATDDIEAWTAKAGHTLVAVEAVAADLRFVVRKEPRRGS